jgi:hypothetical protein
MIDVVMLPWPDRLRVDVEGTLRRGDRVNLRHLARPEWWMKGTVTNLTTPGRSVEVLPDEPITSPANWVIE